MKHMVFKPGLFLITITFLTSAQDKYPYFSDVEKQFEFEQKRIYVQVFERTRMYTPSGSDVSRTPSLVPEKKRSSTGLLRPKSGAEAAGDVAEILSRYLEMKAEERKSYASSEITSEYGFQIFQGHRQISELKFLRIIGLPEVADSILEDHSQQLRDRKQDSVKVIPRNKKSVINEPKPILRQHFSMSQVESLAESYNRRLYKEIANK